MPDPLRLRVRAASAGADSRSLVPGRDLVLRVATEHGLRLPRGVALDDHLDPESRAEVDDRARERFVRWQEQRQDALRVDGLDLGSIAAIELLARCFFPAARIEVGLPRVIEATGAANVAMLGLERDQAAVLRVVAERQSVGVMTDPPPREADTAVVQRTAAPPLPARIASAAAIPALLRGQVLCVPYWNLRPVYERLLERDGARPVAAGVILPGLDTASTVSAALHGGWLGHAGPRLRRRAGADVERLIAGARHGRPPDDELDATLDAWALSVLAGQAPGALAAARHARAALARSPIRSLLVPFDGTADAAVLVDEARRAAIPSLLVQHGFDARLGAPDKGLVDVAALWSERDRETVPAGSGARAVVTGNPGAEHLAAAGGRAPRHNRTLILVDYPSRLSARITERIGQLHVATALEALATARPGTTVLIRPHPSEQAASAYLQIPSPLPVRLDMGTPLEETLSNVDLCIGAMSTATLQAGAVGVPVVYLEVAGWQRPWPLDGSAVPAAHDAAELAEAVTAALARRDVVGQAEMVEALGVRAGATAAVCDLIDELMRNRQ